MGHGRRSRCASSGGEGVGSAFSVLKSYSNPAITSASSGCASRTFMISPGVTTQSLIKVFPTRKETYEPR